MDMSATARGTRGPCRTATLPTSITRDPAGRLTGLGWALADGSLITSDAVVRSASGRVIDQLIDGVDANPAGPNFSYDGPGRLVGASVAGHSLAYAYEPTGRCGPLGTAGANTNRTTLTDTTPAGATTTTFCYDGAVRPRPAGSCPAFIRVGSRFFGYGDLVRAGYRLVVKRDPGAALDAAAGGVGSNGVAFDLTKQFEEREARPQVQSAWLGRSADRRWTLYAP